MKYIFNLLLFIGLISCAESKVNPEEKEEVKDKKVIVKGPVIETDTENGKALFWRISGDNLKADSYLYGTMHVQDQRVFNFSDEVYTALNGVDIYTMEINMDSINQFAMAAQMMMENGAKLSDYLTGEDYELVDRFFTDSLGTPLATFETFLPMMTAQMVSLKSLNLDQAEALDVHFASRAKENGKRIRGLEKAQDQIDALKSLPIESQVEMLVKSVKDEIAGETKAEMDEMIDKYVEGDLEGMLELTDESNEEDTLMAMVFNEKLLVRRNIKMAYGIGVILENNTSFIAVGAAHLGGRMGVIQLLRDKGYTVEPALKK
ncbi:MAG: hypothetical protein ACI8Q1_000394 [Parvicella sp.]|jgi:uncharacterized protein YbaP (TraB family)